MTPEIDSNTPGTDWPVSLAVLPVAYEHPGARMDHAMELTRRARLLPEHMDMEPRLSGGFRMPDQAVSITGAESPLLGAPHGEGLTLLEPDAVRGTLWYGPSEHIDGAMVLITRCLIDQLDLVDEQIGQVDAQYLLCKWRHPECDRALLGLFGGGDQVQEGVAETTAAQAQLLLLHDDRDAFDPTSVGQGIGVLAVEVDEQACIFDLLMEVSLEEETRLDLLYIMEQQHGDALDMRVDEEKRQAWLERMART